MRILLHTNALNERGTTTAIRDYAQGLSKFGHEVSIAFSSNDKSNVTTIFKQVQNEYQTFGYLDFNKFALQNSRKWDLAYFIKYGYNDGKLIPKIPNIVHAVFQSYDPHGEKYIYISEWLAKKMRTRNLKNMMKLSSKGLDSLKFGSFQYLPHIVSLPGAQRNLRSEWGFPEDAIIGGRHGAKDTFDVPMVQNLIKILLCENKKLCFVFANTNQFIEHPRVKFLPSLLSRIETSEYLSSLDFFVHARHRGETFGLSLLEAMLSKVPVFSYSKGIDGNHRFLLRRSPQSQFQTSEQLRVLINQLPSYQDVQLNFEIAKRYSPSIVMQRWQLLLLEIMEKA